MEGHDIVKRHDAMDDYVIGNWKNLWQECADWSLPPFDNVNRIRIAGEEKPPQRLIDSCIEANVSFASGFFSHMFPPNTVWAKFRHPMPNMMANPEVADYFEEVSRAVHQILIGSNFSQQEFESLLCMGTFGTNSLSVEEDDKNIVRFRNYVVSNFRIAENYLGVVDTISREFELEPRQVVQQFGEEALKKAELDQIIHDAKVQKNTKYKFIHMVCPRSDFDKSKRDKMNKPYSSTYVCREGNAIVSEGGFDYNPYKVARFLTGNDEIYGRSPMSMVLGTARRSNVMERSVVVAGEQHTNPQWLVPDDDSVKGLSSRANAVIKWRAINPIGKPERLPPNGDPGIGVEMLDRYEDRIKRFFFNHLFRSLDEYRNMTATEVNERMTTDLMALAPFVSRYTEEKITPIMEHVYYICQKRGILPEVPEALREDPNFEIDYVGRLSLATKNFETLGAVNTARIFMELGQGDPRFIEALDYLDHDKMLIESWYANSASMNSLRDGKDVEKTRAMRQQKLDQQQQVENLAPVADATQKLSGAVDPNSPLAKLAEG
jgi:hypothetical protein